MATRQQLAVVPRAAVYVRPAVTSLSGGVELRRHGFRAVGTLLSSSGYAARVRSGKSGSALNVYQSATAGKTAATWRRGTSKASTRSWMSFVSSGPDFIRYDKLEHDAKGITARAGG